VAAIEAELTTYSPEAIGKRIQEHRERMPALGEEMTIARLAALSGVAPGSLRRLERGEAKKVDLLGLARIAVILGMSMDELIYGEQVHAWRSEYRGRLPNERYRRALNYVTTVLTDEELDVLTDHIGVMVHRHMKKGTFAGPLLMGE